MSGKVNSWLLLVVLLGVAMMPSPATPVTPEDLGPESLWIDGHAIIGPKSEWSYSTVPVRLEIDIEEYQGTPDGVGGIFIASDKGQHGVPLSFHVHSGGGPGQGQKGKGIIYVSATRVAMWQYVMDEDTDRGYYAWLIEDGGDPGMFRNRWALSAGEPYGEAWAQLFGQLRVRPDGSNQTIDLQQWRNAAGIPISRVRIDGLGDFTEAGIATLQVSGTPTDTLWHNPPPDGTLAVDESGEQLCARVNGLWKCVDLD